MLTQQIRQYYCVSSNPQEAGLNEWGFYWETSLGKSGERLEKPGPKASITLNKGERGSCLGCGILSAVGVFKWKILLKGILYFPGTGLP